jgi:Raf kinase inhibitor-like YbhB/YbcL family protein
MCPVHRQKFGKARRAAGVAAGLALTAALSACGVLGADGSKTAALSDWFPVTSSAFRDSQQIPARFACSAYPGGQGKAPPLRWSFADATAFAIVVDDPDAPDGDYVHWVIANIDKNTTELDDPAQLTAAGAVEGRNAAGTVGYTPPCPPKGGKPHRYRFTVYALSGKVPMRQGASLKDTLPEIAHRVIGRGRITGNFGG